MHLTDWPDAADLPADDDLVAAMDRAREICSAASRCARPSSCGCACRWPTSPSSTADAAALEPFGAIIATRSTSRTVTLVDLGRGERVRTSASTQRLTVNARAAGPRLGKDVQQAIKGSKSGDWSVADGRHRHRRRAGPLEGEYALETGRRRRRQDGRTRHGDAAAAAGSSSSTPTVTAELAAEGLARDVVRAVQQARRDAGLDVSDRISLTVTGDEAVWRRRWPTAAADRRDAGDPVRSAPHLDDLAGRGGAASAVGDKQPARILVRKI